MFKKLPDAFTNFMGNESKRSPDRVMAGAALNNRRLGRLPPKHTANFILFPSIFALKLRAVTTNIYIMRKAVYDIMGNVGTRGNNAALLSTDKYCQACQSLCLSLAGVQIFSAEIIGGDDNCCEITAGYGSVDEI